MYITNKGGGIIIFTHTAQKKEFFWLKISSVNVTHPQFLVDTITFAEEILNGKLRFLCSVTLILH